MSASVLDDFEATRRSCVQRGDVMARQEKNTKWRNILSSGARIARMSRIPHFLLATILALAVAGCSGDDKPSAPSAPSAAAVNGDKVLVSEVTRALKRFEASDQFDQLAKQSDKATARRQFEQSYLSQQIKQLVLRSRAEKLGIDIKDEVAKRLEEQKNAYPSDEAFRKALEGMGYTLEEFSGLIRDQVLEEKLREEATGKVEADSKPSEQEIKKYYRSNKVAYHQTEVQHILVNKLPLARKLSTMLRSSLPDERSTLLAELARKYSTDTSNAEEGGKLGWVSPGQFVEPFESAMQELGIGEVSLPVSTDFGVHVIGVTGRRVQTFEDVRDEISQLLTDMEVGQAWSEWLQDAYKNADIELNPRYGELDPVTSQIINASG
jgi:foldase protein PrsA